jgi:hypothetical protein
VLLVFFPSVSSVQPEDGPIKGPKHVVVKFIVHQSVLINSSCVLTVDLYHIVFSVPQPKTEDESITTAENMIVLIRKQVNK